MSTAQFSDAKLLAAAIDICRQFAAGKSELRTYLQSVHVQVIGADKKAHIVATNGNVMAHIEMATAYSDDLCITLRSEHCKDIAERIGKCTGYVDITHKREDGSTNEYAGTMLITHGHVTFQPGYELVEQRFPDWRRVEPKLHAGGLLSTEHFGLAYDSSLLVLAGKAFDQLHKALGNKKGGRNGHTYIRNDSMGMAKPCGRLLLHGGNDSMHLTVTMMGQR